MSIRVVVKNDGTVGKVITGEYNKGVELFYPSGYGNYYESNLEKLTEIEYREGTQEDYVKYIEKDFVWGEVVKTHILGEYQIIEYVDIDNCSSTEYQAYINYEDTNSSYDSLEKAITGAIAYKYDGANSQANTFFWKMIN
jgi:hypothetical protein